MTPNRTKIPSNLQTKMRLCPVCNRKTLARNLFTGELACQNKKGGCRFKSIPVTPENLSQITFTNYAGESLKMTDYAKNMIFGTKTRRKSITSSSERT